MRKKSIIIGMVMVMIAVLCMAVFAKPQKANQQVPKPNSTSIQKKAGPQNKANMRRRVGPRTRMMSVQGMLLPPARPAIDQLSQRLGLNADQKNQILDLSKRFYTRMKPVIQKRAKAMQEVRKLMVSPNLTESSLSAAVSKVEKADKTLVNAEIGYWASFKQILTPDQQKTWAAMTKQVPQNNARMQKKISNTQKASPAKR